MGMTQGKFAVVCFFGAASLGFDVTFRLVGQSDSLFQEVALGVLVMAYGNQQAGQEVWKEVQQRLRVVARDGLASYPVKLNRKSGGGKEFTGVFAQYKPDAISKSGHNVVFHLDEVIDPYGCFLGSFVKTGVAVVPAPEKLGTPCPTQ